MHLYYEISLKQKHFFFFRKEKNPIVLDATEKYISEKVTERLKKKSLRLIKLLIEFLMDFDIVLESSL